MIKFSRGCRRFIQGIVIMQKMNVSFNGYLWNSVIMAHGVLL